jgi:hypothetical protein
LTDPLLFGRSTPVSSCTLARLEFLCADLLGAWFPRYGSRLDPRPVAWFGRGDATRGKTGVSILAARLCDFVGSTGVRFLGIAGTGGASSKLGRADPRFGDGSRNVRSVMDPELPLRSNWAPGGPRIDPATELPIEEFELVLRIVLFVCTSATDVGVVGRARNAAAAAAADNEALEAWGLRKANAAAVCAEGFAFGPLLKD